MTSDTVPLRFLVVDDDEDMRDILVRMVERLGHTADNACDGVEAVESLAVERYDFMLLDLTMPRMSGEDVLRWMGEHRAWAVGLQVIVVSARVGKQQVDADELGVLAVLPKPLRAQTLRDLVDGTLSPTGS